MPLPDFIPYSDEELKEKQLGPYAPGADPSIAGATTGAGLGGLELVPYTGEELIGAVEGNLNKQLSYDEFERYRRAKSLEPEMTWNNRMTLLGEGAQMASEEFFGGIWSAVSQGLYITDPLKGLKTVASGFARGGTDMLHIIEDVFSKDFHAADTYEKFLEDMEVEDDPYWQNIYTKELSKDKMRFNLKRAFMAEREKWRKGETKTVLPLIGEIEGEDVKGAEGLGYVADFTAAVPAAGAFTRLPRLAAKGAGLVGSAGGKVVGGLGRQTLRVTDAIKDKVGKVIPDASTTTTRVATIAGAGVTGQPLVGAALLAPEAGKVLDRAGRLTQKVSEELGKRPSQFGVLERVAMNSSVDPALRKLARILHAGGVGDKLLSGSGSLALGVGTGMAVGGTLGGLAQGEEGFWQGMGAGMTIGGPAALAGTGLSKLTGHARRSAEDADVMRFLEEQAEFGLDPKEAMEKLGRDTLLKTATLAQSFQGEVKVNLLSGSEYKKAHVAGVGAWNPKTRSIDINIDAPDAKHNILHEFGHAIWDSSVVNKREVISELTGLYGQPKIDAWATAYAQRLIEDRFRSRYFGKRTSSKLANEGVAAWKEGRAFKDSKNNKVNLGEKNYEAQVGAEKLDLTIRDPDWVHSEIFAEDFVGSTVDRNINKLRKGHSGEGLFHMKGAILRAKARVLSKMGVPIDGHGIVDGKYTSRLFGEMTGDKKFKKTIRNYIRDRSRHFDEMGRRVKKKGAGPKMDIRKMGDQPGFWRDNGDGTFENDFATKNKNGEVTVKQDEDAVRTLVERSEDGIKLREGLIAKGLIGRNDKTSFGARMNEKGEVEVAGKTIPDDIIDSANLPQASKDQLKLLNELITNGGTFMAWYNGISTTKDGSMRDPIKYNKDGSPDLRGSIRMYRRNLEKYMGNIMPTRRHILPWGYQITKKGHINVQLLDLDAVHDKLHRWQRDTDANGRPKLELWGKDIDKFYEDLKVYMDNHRKGLGGAEGIGEAKRNAIRAFLLRDMTQSGGISPMHDILNNRPVDRQASHVKSFRLERFGSVEPTLRDDFHFDYYKTKENLMPDGTPKVKEHGQTVEFNEAMVERFMPVAPEGARYMDLRDMQQEKMVALTIDRLGHGVRTLPSGAKTELAAQGGRAFMWLQKKWASYTSGPFSTLIGHMKEVGTEYIALTTLGELNHNNTRSGMRYFGESIRDAVKRGDISRKQGDAYVKHVLDATSNLGPMKSKGAQAERAALRDIDTVQKFIDAVDEGLITHKAGEQLTKQRGTLGTQHGIKTAEAEALGFGPRATAEMAVDRGLWDGEKFPIGTIVAVMKLKHDAKVMHEPSLHYHYPYTVDVEPVAYLKKFYPLSSLSRGKSRALDKHGKPTGGNVFYKDNPKFDDGSISPRGLQAIAPELDLLTEGKMGPPIDHPVNYMPSVSNEIAFSGAIKNHGLTRNINEAGYILPDGKMLDFSGRHWTDEYRLKDDQWQLKKSNQIDHMAGQRQVDHRDINYDGVPADEQWSGMVDFMSRGAVRVDAQAGMVSVHGRNPVTARQEAKIKEIADLKDGQIYLDAEDDSGKRLSVNYDVSNSKKIIGDLRRWARGDEPESGDRFMPETHWSNRDPVLEKARKAGVSGEAWDNLVDLRRPVMMAPKPTKGDLLPDEGPTSQEVTAASKNFKKGDEELKTSLAMLNPNQRKLIGATRQTPEGTNVGVRLDIPFFQNTLKRFKEGILNKVGYALTIHGKGTEGGVGDVMGYDTVARVKNAVFHIAKGIGTKRDDIEGVAAGTRSKFPNATVEGEWVSVHDRNGKVRDDAIPHDIYNTDKWIQVGMDPRRHEYFYRKDNHRVPIESASEAILVGNTAFVRADDALVQGDRSQHRYMPAQTARLEADYMDAVAKGDVDTMQAAVDQAATRAGFNDDTVYHGTPTGEFTKFDKDLGGTGPISGNPIAKHGFFFAPDSEYAKRYAGPEGKVIPTKLSYSKPYKQNMWAMREIENAQGVATEDGVAAYIDKVKADGHDAIELTSGEGGAVVETMVFNPNQIKSADPATFDDNGNVIPLHDRFNLESDDIRYIPAYHGTPHTFAAEEGAPLGKFSTDKIGTGEGAQAYGHGMYFAERKSVAEWYRDKLSGGSESDRWRQAVSGTKLKVLHKGKDLIHLALNLDKGIDGVYLAFANVTSNLVNMIKQATMRDGPAVRNGKPITDTPLRLGHESYKKNQAAAFVRVKLGGMIKASEFELKGLKQDVKSWEHAQSLTKMDSDLADLTAARKRVAEKEEDIKRYKQVDPNDFTLEGDIIKFQGGEPRIYEVDITPKDEHFLDLDKPFKEQSKYVKDALETLAIHLTTDDAAHVVWQKYVGAYKYPFPDSALAKPLHPTLSFVRQLEGAVGEKRTSELLAQSGIAGNRFQDAPTRASSSLGKEKKPTYNYVVFEDSAVEIKNRYMPRVSEDGKVVTMPTKGRIVQTGTKRFRAYNLSGKLMGVAATQAAADALLNRGKK